FLSTPDHFNRRLNAVAAHYYCGTAGRSATEYGTNDWYELLYKATLIERLILDQRAAIDEFAPQRKLGLVIDEWGTWHFPTPGDLTAHNSFDWSDNVVPSREVADIERQWLATFPSASVTVVRVRLG